MWYTEVRECLAADEGTPAGNEMKMKKIKELAGKYYEAAAYLFFGALATALNILIFTVFDFTLGSAFAAGVGNVINNAVCILFAYFTNRLWVFRSKSKGVAALKEFFSFVACRIGTALADQGILWLGVMVLGPIFIKGNSVTIFMPGSSLSFDDAKLWNLGVKLFSQVVVIVSNYIFSKLFIFKKKKEESV